MPQTPSAVGPSITPDWLLTQAVLKKCAWLTTFLSFYLGKSEVLWSGIRLGARTHECWDQCALALQGGSWCCVWELAGLDRWLRFWFECHLREDAGLAPPALSFVNFPALYKTLVSSFLGRYCWNHKSCLVEKVIWNIWPFTFLLFWNRLRKKIPLTTVRTRMIIFWKWMFCLTFLHTSKRHLYTLRFETEEWVLVYFLVFGLDYVLIHLVKICQPWGFFF